MGDLNRRVPAIDPRAFAALTEIADGDFAFLRDVIGQFLGDGASLLDQLVEAVRAGECEPMTRAAHTLKSSSGHVGALGLSAIADRLQCLGREGRMHGCRRLADTARSEMDRVRCELEARLEKLAD
jgi:HPt (histidine-containing phosphotransfer) domain-containing protein